MNPRLVELGKRYARLATRAVVAHPRLWWLFRGPLRRQFDSLAPSWDDRRGPASVEILAARSTGSTPRRGACSTWVPGRASGRAFSPSVIPRPRSWASISRRR